VGAAPNKSDRAQQAAGHTRHTLPGGPRIDYVSEVVTTEARAWQAWALPIPAKCCGAQPRCVAT
jgi:hypothetical protein